MGEAGEEFSGTERFRITRRLGQGAMGTVYLANDAARGTEVALKTLRRIDAASLYRFKQEFRSLADVSHPNLVLLHELLSAEGHWFFTMELVEGCDFLQYVWNQPAPSAGGFVIGLESSDATKTGAGAESIGNDTMTAEIAVAGSSGSGQIMVARAKPERLRLCLRQLAEGVHALHETGHLHRDIKPSNIMVTPSGRVVLMDFGIIADLSVSREHERGIAIGTPAYMSPEQVEGQLPTRATDWYAVGLILFEALTGRRPFPGTNTDQMQARLLMDPPRVDSVVAGIPGELATLCDELLRRNASNRPTGSEILVRLGADAVAVRTELIAADNPLAAGKLVGRGEELEELHRNLVRAQSGLGSAVFLSGRSGMGKTTLARAFLKEAVERNHAVVLAGRCHERESVPYKAIDSLIDALSRYLIDLPTSEVAKLLPRDTPALSRMFPVLRRVKALAGRKPAMAEADPQELRSRGFAALRGLLARLAERHTLVLFIDDLQWGDQDSAGFLTDLLRPPAPPPLLFLGCYRRIEGVAIAPLDRLLSGTEQSASHLEVTPLDQAAATELAAQLLGVNADSDARASALARESAGDPYFVQALVDHLGAATGDGDEPQGLSLAGILDRRINELSDPARRLLEILVAAGRPIARGLAVRAARVSDHGDALVLELRRARLVRGRGAREDDAIAIYHSRISRVVEERMASPRARGRHLSLARNFESSPEPDFAAISFHYRAAGEPVLAGQHAMRAANHAREALAFDRAARLYGDAVELLADDTETCQSLLIQQAKALTSAGRSVEAADTYARAALNAPAELALELKRTVAEHYLRGGRVAQGLVALDEVVGAVGMKMPAERGVLLSLALLRARVWLRGTRFRLRPPEDIPAATRQRLLVARAGAVGLAMVDVLRGTAFQARAYLLALHAGEPHTLARTLCAEAAFISFSGPAVRRRVERLLETARALGDEHDDPAIVPWADGCEALAAYLSGRFRRALELADAAERGFERLYAGAAWERTTARMITLWSLFYLGRFREQAQRGIALVRDADERGDVFAATIFSIGTPGFHALARDDVDGARAARKRAMQRWPSTHGYHTQHWWDLSGRVRIALYEGDPEQAWSALRSEWPRVCRAQLHRSALVRLEGAQLWAKTALVAARKCEPGSVEFRRWLRQARRHCRQIERIDMEIAPPMAHLIRAALAAAGGHARPAAQLFDRAARGFDACDAAAYAAVARRQEGQLREALGEHARGQELVEECDRLLISEDVGAPASLAGLLAPSFDLR